MSISEIATVLARHHALNAVDCETLVTLSSDDIDVGSRFRHRIPVPCGAASVGNIRQDRGGLGPYVRAP